MSNNENIAAPIFIHSLYRSGSTYLFNVFRRSEGRYFCYQEPEHEFLINLNENPDVLLDVHEDMADSLRHPKLTRPYFWEFHQIQESLNGLFKKTFSFDDFFCLPADVLSTEQTSYFGALIEHAKARPVLQFCRSAGRVAAFKAQFGGAHLHLWREPRNQWWSFKVNDFFDPAVLLIYNARNIPSALAEVRTRCQIGEIHADTIGDELTFFRQHPLTAAENYLAFFGLWLYSYIEFECHADISISVERLSSDEDYRERITRKLEMHGIAGLDFSDADIPHASFAGKEINFYHDIEQLVLQIFQEHGYHREALDQAFAAKEALSALTAAACEPLGSVDDSVRARRTALRLLDQSTEASARAIASMAKAEQIEAESRLLVAELASTRQISSSQHARILVAEEQSAGIQEQLNHTQAELSGVREIVLEQSASLVVANQEMERLHGQVRTIHGELAAARSLAEERRASMLCAEQVASKLRDQVRLVQEQLQTTERIADAHRAEALAIALDRSALQEHLRLTEQNLTASKQTADERYRSILAVTGEKLDLQTELESTRELVERQHAAALAAQRQMDALSQQLEDIHASRSWRLTSPMRAASMQFSKLFARKRN